MNDLSVGGDVNKADETERIRKGLNTNFGVEWYINDSSSLTTAFFYRDSDNESNTTNNLFQYDSDRVLTGESTRYDPQVQDNKSATFSTNFTKNFENSGKFILEFQYENTDEDENSDVIVESVNSEKVSTLEEQDRILIQSDYVLPIGENTQFEVGYRGSFKDITTDYTVELLNEISNELSCWVWFMAPGTWYLDTFAYLDTEKS